jgi:hypothetical protein
MSELIAYYQPHWRGMAGNYSLRISISSPGSEEETAAYRSLWLPALQSLSYHFRETCTKRSSFTGLIHWLMDWISKPHFLLTPHLVRGFDYQYHLKHHSRLRTWMDYLIHFCKWQQRRQSFSQHRM